MRADDALGEEHRRFLGIVDRNSERLLELVSDLLFLAQIEAGKLSLELGPVELEEVIHDCIESSSPAAERGGIELTTQIEHVPAVRGDRAQLVQVLDNLVSNALKFMPRGGSVEVRLRAAEARRCSKSATRASGSPRKTRRSCSSFLRSARATEHAIPGTGLGLTISKAIVERHGGRIELRSGDTGTTVRVELPLSARVLEVGAPGLAA